MKQFIPYLLLGALLGVIPPPVPAQQNQSSQHTTQEIQVLKNRISELEKQLQTVENVEKLELQAKLAEANAKLLDSEFANLERELRDSHNEWLIKWSIFVLTLLTAVGAALWSWLKSRTNQLIENQVEKNLDGFKEAVDQVGLMKNQLGVLEKKYTISTLEDFINDTLVDERSHFEQIKGLREEPLVDIFDDEEKNEAIRYKAAEVLVARKSPRLVSPMLRFLNSVVDSESHIDFDKKRVLRAFINFFAYIYTQETYEGLTKFLYRLLNENPRHKDLFLTWTVLSLGWVSVRLDKRDAVSILKEAIPHLEGTQLENKDLIQLARHFDRFNEAAGIKEILTNHVASGRSDVEEKCLELMGKYDRDFVQEWGVRRTREQLLAQANEGRDEATNNTES